MVADGSTFKGRPNMEDRSRRRTLLQIFFALSLALSLVAFLASLPRVPGPKVPLPENPEETTDLLVAVASLLTAVTSLVGLVWTTFIGWRKEQREAEAAELERERRELEIEKLRREVEEARAKQASNGS
jgi:hypothetical protein